MITYHLFALTFSCIVDRIIGDPENWPHPARWIGTLIYKLEKSWNKGTSRRRKGIGMLLTVLLTVGAMTV